MSCALRVTNISNFRMSSLSKDIICYCGNVSITHVLPVKHPKSGVPERIIFNMFFAVLVSSGITKPDIITSISCNECGWILCTVHYPTISRIKNSVLEEHRRLGPGRSFVIMTGNSKNCEDISVLGCNFVLFEFVSFSSDYFLERVSEIIF